MTDAPLGEPSSNNGGKIKLKIRATPVQPPQPAEAIRQRALQLLHRSLAEVMRAESITALEDAIWARDCDDRLERSIRDRRYGDSVHIACTAHKTDPSLELAYQDQETIVLMELLFPDLSARSLQAEAYRLAHGAKEIESVVKCRCGGNTTVRCSQTRSADEAMTEFYRCVGGNGRAGCGRSWKV